MSQETTKSTNRRKKEKFFQDIFKGHVIDVGCGDDVLDKNAFPNIESVEPFDLKDGDAQKIAELRKENYYDVVHSSQCLEHMKDVNEALKNWIKITKPGGHLVITVPDFNLYEQGYWPSLYNHDHKFTFTIKDEGIARDDHIVLSDWLKGFEDVKVLSLKLIDTNYNYELKDVDQTRGDAEAFIEFVLEKKSGVKEQAKTSKKSKSTKSKKV